MTVLSPDSINGWRGIVQWSLRGIAVALIAFGAYLCLKRVFFAIGTQSFQTAFQAWTSDLGERHSFYRGVSLLIVGGVLAASSRRLSRWMIAVPPTSCPRCGHPRTPGGGARCPECGWGRD